MKKYLTINLPEPKKTNKRFKVISHIIMFISMLIFPLIFHLLLEGMKLIEIEPSKIFTFIFTFVSNYERDFFMFLPKLTVIVILTSVITATISFYKYRFANISVNLHAIANIALALTAINFFVNLGNNTGNSNAFSSCISAMIVICVVTIFLIVIFEVKQFIKNKKRIPKKRKA